MADEDITNVLGFGNDKDDTLRARFEIGECDTRYFLDHVLALCKPGTTDQQLIDAWNKIHTHKRLSHVSHVEYGRESLATYFIALSAAS